jgi:hypothetical protein
MMVDDVSDRSDLFTNPTIEGLCFCCESSWWPLVVGLRCCSESPRLPAGAMDLSSWVLPCPLGQYSPRPCFVGCVFSSSGLFFSTSNSAAVRVPTWMYVIYKTCQCQLARKLPGERGWGYTDFRNSLVFWSPLVNQGRKLNLPPNPIFRNIRIAH